MITIQIKGGKELAQSFLDAPKLVKQFMNDGIEESAKLIKQRTSRVAGSPPIVYKGDLARSIGYKMGNLRATVGSDAIYAGPVEFGRNPGSMPPSAPLERWARIKIGKSGIGFAIARKIAHRGTKAQPYFFPSVQESLGDIQHIFEKYVSKLVGAL